MFGLFKKKENEPEEELELTETASLTRYAYGLSWAFASVYVPLRERLPGNDYNTFIKVDPPTVSFGPAPGLDESLIHVCEFDVIKVPAGYIVDKSVDGTYVLYDEDDNPCTVTCDAMSDIKFKVSSAKRTFMAPLMPAFIEVMSYRNEDGRADSKIICTFARPDKQGYFTASSAYREPMSVAEAEKYKRLDLARPAVKIEPQPAPNLARARSRA